MLTLLFVTLHNYSELVRFKTYWYYSLILYSMIFSIQKFLAILVIIAITIPCISGSKTIKNYWKEPIPITVLLQPTIESVYDSLHLDQKGLSKVAFDYAINGYKELKQRNASQWSHYYHRWFWPTKLQQAHVHFDVKISKCYSIPGLQHGRNTGQETAKYFSNRPQSYQSSLDFILPMHHTTVKTDTR